jgi:hypothetical protein
VERLDDSGAAERGDAGCRAGGELERLLASMSGASAGPSNGRMAFADAFSPRGSSEPEARAVK